MGFILLMSLLPMALVAWAVDASNDDDETSEPETPGEEIVANQGTLTTGTAGDDTITGEVGRGAVTGLGGDDEIRLGATDDGNANSVADDALSDLIASFSVDEAGDVMEALRDLSVFGADGGAGDDYIDAGHGADTVTGGAGDDTLRGNLGDDLLVDAYDADSLSGGYGDDLLVAVDAQAQAGADVLDGGANDDLLWGDAGDTMTGGTGDDTFMVPWTSGDAPVTITDFAPGYLSGTDEPAENVLIALDSWSDTQSFTVVPTETGMAVKIDGEVVAQLTGVVFSDWTGQDVFALDMSTGAVLSPIYVNV